MKTESAMVSCLQRAVICNLNETEDEMHFIRSCPKYKEKRKYLDYQLSNLDINYNNLSEFQKFIYIMKVPEQSCTHVEKFIREIVKIRGEL